MSYKIIFDKIAKTDIDAIKKSGDKSSLKKLNKILDELGNPEQLKHNLSGYWSRRINKMDRLIYEIIEEPDRLVVVVSALGHY